MNDDVRMALRDAFEAASPHLVTAAKELLAAGSAFVAALMGEGDQSTTVVEVDVTSDD